MPSFKSGQKTLCQIVHNSFSAEVSQKLNLRWLAILLKDGTLEHGNSFWERLGGGGFPGHMEVFQDCP